MISVSAILACMASLFISLILPLLILIVYGIRSKGKGIWSAWLLGAAGFFVTQILIRVPIVSVLSTAEWFTAFAHDHYWLYAFLLAFTAGLFELAGRYAVAKCMKRNLTFRRALAAGLGHGGIEAMLVVGVTYINNLIYIFMINSGTFDTVLAQAAAAGVDVSQLELLRDTFLTTSGAMFLLGGFERILAMIAQASMSVIVCCGVHTQRVAPALLLCLGIHTLIDCTAGVSALSTDAMGSVLSQNAVYWIIYTILVVVAILSVFILRAIRRRWDSACSPDSQDNT